VSPAAVASWPGARRSLDAYDLDGSRALVLGATGGSGRAIALALAEAGADLALCAAGADPAASAALAETLAGVAATGRRAVTHAIDASRAGDVEAMVRRVVAELGGIDVLVNAPDPFLGKPATEVSDAEWDRVIGRNLGATFFACRAVGRHMLERGDAGRSGRIVNVTSVLGERGLANAAAFCAAQGGVLNLTRALAQEWAPHGITVNAIVQGWMEDSPALAGSGPETGRAVRFIPMKRAGRPDEVAPLAVYLASPASGYVTGQTLFVDGGLTVHL